ncbi:MAG: hypothetical protein HY331_17115 [Chloroflexi bacterium]|nr:hypothetical protein [Chloroflexota bacterium]
MTTRLTITLPEELSRRARARAALEGVSLSAVIRKHLEEFAAGLDVLEEAADLRAVREIEARLARGEEAVYDWEETFGPRRHEAARKDAKGEGEE